MCVRMLERMCAFLYTRTSVHMRAHMSVCWCSARRVARLPDRRIPDSGDQAGGGEDWKAYVAEHLEEGFKGNRYMWSPSDEVMTAKDMARFWATARTALQRARACQSPQK